MFLVLGSAAGNPELTTFAVTAAMFHLFTHAFFKALLFLGAGSVMHSMGDIIDMRRFSGLRKVMPWTCGTFFLGALALSGIFPLAGFWSKDELLAAVHDSLSGPFGPYFLVLYAIALFTAFLTPFYTFRAFFMTFFGPEKFPPEAGHHPHESPWVMLLPLVVLAVCSVLVGLVFGPTHWFAHYLAKTPYLPHDAGPPALHWDIMLLSTAIGLAGIGGAYLLYVRFPAWPAKLRGIFRGMYQLSVNKFYLDEIYDVLVVHAVWAFAGICRAFDQYIVDGLVDFVGTLPSLAGKYIFRPVQNGLLQFYALFMILGLALFTVAVVVRLWG
jgi:NADH-quinone oxidoreductase subunit L